MSVRRTSAIGVTALLALLAASWLPGAVLPAGAAEAQAQQAQAPDATAALAGTAVTARVGQRFATGGTSIVGWTRGLDNLPIPDATLRLRNVLSGRVEATALSSSSGEFVFADIEGGSYVIELVDDGGRILTVSQVFTISPGETVATIIRLTARRSFLAGLFGGSGANAAAAAVSAAAGAGITATAPPGRSASPDDIP